MELFNEIDTWLDLPKSSHPKTTSPEISENLAKALTVFDYTTSGEILFTPWQKPHLPDIWHIGLIVGSSGSGKSTLLKEFGQTTQPTWDNNQAIGSQLGDNPAEILTAVGMSSVPTWAKPYNVLSTGEKFRADLAKTIVPGAVIDEFTSVVDRNVAKSASKTISSYIRRQNIYNIVFATCHRDVTNWLQPDWIIDTDAGKYCIQPQECLQQPNLVLQIYEVQRTLWQHFVGHHYLASSLHPFARCYLATLENEIAAFGAAIPFPNGHIKNAWREHRTVTLPDFQGLGIGVKLSDWIAEAHVRNGYRYFSRTTHPRMGEYRQRSPKWKATSSNLKPQKLNPSPNWSHWNFDNKRIAYSHEFVGTQP